MWHTILNFSQLDPEMARQAYDLGKDVRDWKVYFAQKDLKETGPTKAKICQILYRPFDIRYTYYTGRSRGFQCMPRPEVMRHMLEENLGLIFHKREELNIPYSHFLITTDIIEHGFLSSKTTCYLAPLHIYPNSNQKGLFSQHQTEKKPNIPEALFEKLELFYRQKPSPEGHLPPIITFSKNYVNWANNLPTCICSKARNSIRRLPNIRVATPMTGLKKLRTKKMSNAFPLTTTNTLKALHRMSGIITSGAIRCCRNI